MELQRDDHPDAASAEEGEPTNADAENAKKSGETLAPAKGKKPSKPDSLRQAPKSLGSPRTTTPRRKSGTKKGTGSKGDRGFASVIKSLTWEIQKKKEACDSIRFLVFVWLGNESMRANEKHLMYEARQGTRQEIYKLHQVWSQMDEDGSGDIEFQEFLNFFSRKKADRLLGMRCVKYLVGGGDREGASCTIEDMRG